MRRNEMFRHCCKQASATHRNDVDLFSLIKAICEVKEREWNLMMLLI